MLILFHQSIAKSSENSEKIVFGQGEIYMQNAISGWTWFLKLSLSWSDQDSNLCGIDSAAHRCFPFLHRMSYCAALIQFSRDLNMQYFRMDFLFIRTRIVIAFDNYLKAKSHTKTAVAFFSVQFVRMSRATWKKYIILDRFLSKTSNYLILFF